MPGALREAGGALMVRFCALLLTFSLAVPIVARAGPTGPTVQGDPQAVAEYNAAYEKFGDARTWRSRMTVPGSGAITSEFVAPDRIRILITVGNQTVETISIGDTHWTRVGGRCARATVKSETPNPREAMQRESGATVQVTRGNPETVEGTPTQTYMVTITSRGTTVRQKLYVATQTGYPRRLETSTERGTMAIDYFDFNAAITIEPPC